MPSSHNHTRSEDLGFEVRGLSLDPLNLPRNQATEAQVSTCAPASPEAESTRKEYDDVLNCIHMNPVQRGLVDKARE